MILDILFNVIGIAVAMFGALLIAAGFTSNNDEAVHVFLIGLCIIFFAMSLIGIPKALSNGLDIAPLLGMGALSLLIAGGIYLYSKNN